MKVSGNRSTLHICCNYVDMAKSESQCRAYAQSKSDYIDLNDI